jgi:hypothetical protein
MLMKTAIALVLIAGTASGALAQKNTNTRHDVYDITGKYVGSDPDPTIRFMLQRDRGSD